MLSTVIVLFPLAGWEDMVVRSATVNIAVTSICHTNPSHRFGQKKMGWCFACDSRKQFWKKQKKTHTTFSRDFAISPFNFLSPESVEQRKPFSDRAGFCEPPSPLLSTKPKDPRWWNCNMGPLKSKDWHINDKWWLIHIDKWHTKAS